GRSARRQGGAGRCRAGDQTGACRNAWKNWKRNDRTGITPDMNLPRPISIVAGLAMAMAATTVSAQISLTPPAAQPPASAPAAKKKETSKEAPKPKAATAAKKPPATPKPAATPTPTPTPTPSPTATFDDPNVDLV